VLDDGFVKEQNTFLFAVVFLPNCGLPTSVTGDINTCRLREACDINDIVDNGRLDYYFSFWFSSSSSSNNNNNNNNNKLTVRALLALFIAYQLQYSVMRRGIPQLDWTFAMQCCSFA
jgi:hypothetical protein